MDFSPENEMSTKRMRTADGNIKIKPVTEHAPVLVPLPDQVTGLSHEQVVAEDAVCVHIETVTRYHQTCLTFVGHSHTGRRLVIAVTINEETGTIIGAGCSGYFRGISDVVFVAVTGPDEMVGPEDSVMRASRWLRASCLVQLATVAKLSLLCQIRREIDGSLAHAVATLTFTNAVGSISLKLITADFHY
jgi:hypothetical protein